MSQPTLGIVIPAYNDAAWIRFTIESALAQTSPADEIMVFVHDATDGTPEIARSFEPRIRVVEENPGLNVGQAWNRAFDHAAMDYSIFVHSDDILLPDCVARYREELAKHPEAILFTGRFKLLSEDGSQLTPSPVPVGDLPHDSESYLRGFCTEQWQAGTWGMCVRTAAVRQHPFRTDMAYQLDTEWTFRLAQKGPIVVVPDELSAVRQRQRTSLRGRMGDVGYANRRLWWTHFAAGQLDVSPAWREPYGQYIFNVNADPLVLATRGATEGLTMAAFWREHWSSFSGYWWGYLKASPAKALIMQLAVVGGGALYPLAVVAAKTYWFARYAPSVLARRLRGTGAKPAEPKPALPADTKEVF